MKREIRGASRSTEEQAAGAVLMVRPRHFASNAETAASNRFQSGAATGTAAAPVNAVAREELDALAAALERAGVDVHLVEGQTDRRVPDEVFPNNWVSFHSDGTAVLYPMMAPSRRLERRRDVLDALQRAHGYRIEQVVDLSALEQEQQFLEGTGSLVLDRRMRVGYACLSPRTSRRALAAFGERLGYEIAAFDAFDAGGHPVYHTNVLLAIGTRFSVVCSAALTDVKARCALLERLGRGGRQIIDIGLAQMEEFAGNLLELRGRKGPVIALSETAFAALDDAQRAALASHGQLVRAAVPTIETHGGGSVRCMLAEIHLPRAR